MTLRDKRGKFKKGNEGFWLGKKRLNLLGEHNPRWAGEKINHICEICGKEFRRPNTAKGKIPKYCSMKCYGRSKQNKPAWNKYGKNPWCAGKNNPMWKGGITPKHWNIRNTARYKEWKEAVHERDNYNCMICGDSSNKIVVHHIKSSEKYPKLRFELSNGITLCRRCHKNLHAENKDIHDFTKILRDYTPDA